MTDENEIKAQCQKYIDAFDAADSSKMAGVFHASATIQGHVKGDPWGGNADDLAAFCDSNPPGSESGMRGTIRILDMFDRSAAVRIDIESYHGLGFTDFLSLQKIDGEWIIVGKSFSGP